MQNGTQGTLKLDFGVEIADVKPKITPNPRQKEAIDTINGPVMLLAGPGTGKTFTLIERIKNMLQKGVLPSEILCLTFSEAASSEMKTRLVKGVENATAAMGVCVSTYHSFCKDIIDRFPSKFELLDNVQVVDDITKQAIVKECMDEYHTAFGVEYLKDKWNNRYHFVGQIISAIDYVKRERISKEEYFKFYETNPDWLPRMDELKEEYKEREEKGKLVKTFVEKFENFEKKLGKAKEFYAIYELYEKGLRQHNLIDFSDMLNLVLKTVEYDDELLNEVASGYKYILVDEYQDTNSGQNELIFQIARGAKTDNVFVVGDDDQIIYSFQGARCDNLKNFLKKYPGTNVICLNENNRSSQLVLDFAEDIIKNDKSRLTNDADLIHYGIDKKLTAKNKNVIEKEEKIHFSFYGQTIQENNKIADEIENLINKGIEPKEIAILSKRNDFLIPFAKILKAKNIPYQLNRQKSVFEIPAFITTYFYLKCLDNTYKGADKLFGLLVNEPFLIDEKDYYELLKQSRLNVSKKEKLEIKDRNFFNIIEENLDTIFKDSKGIQEFYSTFISLKRLKSSKSLTAFIYDVIIKTGILEYYSNRADEKFENLAAIKRLTKEAYSYSALHKTATLSDFISHLDTYLNQGIKMEIEKNPYSNNAVQLLTYHGSKGREFEYVFMPQLTARLWEKSRPPGKLELPVEESRFLDDKTENKKAELLKLMFVGITRSKYGLYLSYANCDDEMNVQAVSEYLQSDILNNEKYCDKNSYELDLDTYTEELKNFILYQDSSNVQLELKERTENITVSASSLNEYLSCPLKYYYSDILNVPVLAEDIDNLSYGSAVHFALEKMARVGRENGCYPPLADVLGYFKEKMDTLEFKDAETREEYQRRGEELFNMNYLKLAETPVESILASELRLEFKEEGYILKGFADRVVKAGDKIYIYDFKTGTPKKVKPDENYHNQLRFYKYLYEKINPGVNVFDCALLYVEKGFTYSNANLADEDNIEIEKKIKAFVEDVKNLHFEPTPSSDACKYCAYSLICKLAQKD